MVMLGILQEFCPDLDVVAESVCVYHCTPPNPACAEGLLTSEVYKYTTYQI